MTVNAAAGNGSAGRRTYPHSGLIRSAPLPLSICAQRLYEAGSPLIRDLFKAHEFVSRSALARKPYSAVALHMGRGWHRDTETFRMLVTDHAGRKVVTLDTVDAAIADYVSRLHDSPKRPACWAMHVQEYQRRH